MEEVVCLCSWDQKSRGLSFSFDGGKDGELVILSPWVLSYNSLYFSKHFPHSSPPFTLSAILYECINWGTEKESNFFKVMCQINGECTSPISLARVFSSGSYCVSLKKGVRSLRKEEDLKEWWDRVTFKSKLDTHLTPFQVAPHSPLILNPTPTPIENSAAQDHENHYQSYYHC